MATCHLCPIGDRDVPDEILLQHMQLLHGSQVSMLPIEAPAGATPEEVDRWGTAILTAIKPMVQKMNLLEGKLFSAYSAGFKDSWGEACLYVSHKLRAEAADREQKAETHPHLLPIAHGLHLGAGLADGIRDGFNLEGTPGPGPEHPPVLGADDILRALSTHPGDPIDYHAMQIAVAVTPAPDGSTAEHDGPWWPFTPGELIVVDTDGREIWTESARVISDWLIGFEYFRSLPDALKRSAEVRQEAIARQGTAAPLPSGDHAARRQAPTIPVCDVSCGCCTDRTAAPAGDSDV